MTASQPIYGQTPNIFGRRSLIVTAVFLFAVDSAICDSALSLTTPTVGRAIKAYGVGVAIGPVVGGSLSERVSWRWVFYLNLPIAAAGLLCLSYYLKLVLGRRRVPLGIMESTINAAPGLRRLAAFIMMRCSGLISKPTMPLRLFINRTSLAAFGLALIHFILMYWHIYFLPLYFQFVLEASPVTSGVYMLPTVVISMIFSVVSGTGLSKMGRYHPWHFSGMGLFAISYGLFSPLTRTLRRPFGPASIKVPVAERTSSLPRAHGISCAASAPARSWRARTCARLLSNGGAYDLASGGFITSLNYDPTLNATVKNVYTDSLKLTWQVGIGFAMMGAILFLVTKEIPLRTKLETQFGFSASEKPRLGVVQVF
ncbi:hypothetical protein DL771_006798 [Monosporascus sp. 5C6A]|nr:hypothetical protein DL771_006798 [Monosporascus sp. 5C6A]